MSIAAATSQAHRGTADPVRAVSVISTSVRDPPRACPRHEEAALLVAVWMVAAPATNVYVIEHARGLLLFDTGQDRASVTDDSAPRAPTASGCRRPQPARQHDQQGARPR